MGRAADARGLLTTQPQGHSQAAVITTQQKSEAWEALTHVHQPRLVPGAILHAKPLRPRPLLLLVLRGLRHGNRTQVEQASGAAGCMAGCASLTAAASSPRPLKPASLCRQPRRGVSQGACATRWQSSVEAVHAHRDSQAAAGRHHLLPHLSPTCGGFHSSPLPAGMPKRAARCSRLRCSSSVNRSCGTGDRVHGAIDPKHGTDMDSRSDVLTGCSKACSEQAGGARRATHNAGGKARAVKALLACIQPHVVPLAGVHVLDAKLLGAAARRWRARHGSGQAVAGLAAGTGEGPPSS